MLSLPSAVQIYLASEPIDILTDCISICWNRTTPAKHDVCC